MQQRRGPEWEEADDPELIIGALVRVAEEAQASLSEASLLRRLASAVAQLVRARVVVFWRVTDGRLYPQAGATGIGEDALAAVGDLSCRAGDDHPLAATVHGDGLMRLPAGEAGLPTPGSSWTAVAPGAPALATGWRAGGRRLGMVSAHDPTGGEFSPADILVLRTVAQAAGLVWVHPAWREDAEILQAEEAIHLRAAAERMRELERLKSDFLNLAAHELRGPIAVLGGYLAMMDDGTVGALPRDAAALLPHLRAQATQMNGLVDQMLEAARLEDGRLGIRLEKVDLVDAVAEVVDEERMRIGGAHAIAVTATAPSIQVLGDDRRLKTVVRNLVDNAAKYSPPGTPIEVVVRAHQRLAEVAVRDHGWGIAPDGLSRLFTRFGRIVTGQNSHLPGTGLGLYVSREVALMHGGDITVDSVEATGSVFTLTLPLDVDPGAEDRAGERVILERMGVPEAVRLAATLREAVRGASSMSEAAARVVHLLHDALVLDSGDRATVLVRCFTTYRFEVLDTPLQALAVAGVDRAEVTSATRCLTLLATAGERPEWCSPALSRNHQVIPLPSRAALRASPMVAHLVQQLLGDESLLLRPDPSLMVDAEPQPYNVFHVEHARGSSHIPSQDDFVVPHGIASAVGFGGRLPSGELLAVIMFARVHVSRDVAAAFRAVAQALSVAMASPRGQG